MTVVGTRPEIIRLSRVITRLDETCDHMLVHTGQNYDYELNGIFFEDLGLRAPDHYLGAAGTTSAETIGNVIVSVDKLLREAKPEAVLVLGDTNSCLAVVAAKRQRIPTFHMEAGNRCFDMRVPEELNRRIVDHTADVNLTYSAIAREYLLREGLPPDRIIRTGSPMYEVLNFYRDRIASSDIVRRLGLQDRQYLVASFHREENVDDPERLKGAVEVLNAVAQKYQMPVIVSTHPRTRIRLGGSGLQLEPSLQLLAPMKFSDYVKLQTSSFAVLSDSGTISEESSILGFKALNIRETHERPEAMEEAAVMMVGLNVERALQCLALIEEESRGNERRTQEVAEYLVPNVSEKVLRILLSYRDYVMREVWRVQ